jgi:two-component system, OmpR family, KDP operon response regulator KdpE
MRPPRALLLYQDSNGTDQIRTVLKGEGFLVEDAPVESRPVAAGEGYSILVFDIHRFTARLLDVIRMWRDEVPDTILVIAGSRTAQATRMAVLETGVEAFLTKPVALPELRARVRATLRRFRSQNASVRKFDFGSGIIDLEARRIVGAGRDTRLTRTECGILEHLALHMNQTVPSTDLVKTLWGDDPQKGVHSLRLFIRKLRNKLEPDPAHPQYLVTEPTIGYRLQTRPQAATKSLDG